MMPGPNGEVRGDRVRLVAWGEQPEDVEPGTLGTVTFVDGMGTVHADWDNGAKLGLCASAGDRWERVIRR